MNTTNPASMIASGYQSAPIDTVTRFLVGIGNAAAAHPIMTAAGLAAIVGIMWAARHMTKLGNETARKTRAAHDAAKAATEAVRSPGKLTPAAISDAFAVPSGHNYTKHDSIVNRTAFADTLPPPVKVFYLGDYMDDSDHAERRAYRDTQMLETLPMPFRG